METFEESKNKFIQSWGQLGESWGITRTLAQIHALLLISDKPLTAEEIMESLGISRGNVSMSLKELLNWGIVFKESRPNDRKEYYRSEGDIWKLAVQVAKERRKRELDPVIKMLKEVKEIPNEENNPSILHFNKTIEQIEKFGLQADKTLELFIKASDSWFLKIFK